MTNTFNAPITSALKSLGSFVDNSIALSAKNLGLNKIFLGTGISKKLGARPEDILMAVILMPMVRKESIWAFCSRFLEQYKIGQKDVIYRFLANQCVRWSHVVVKLSDSFLSYHQQEVWCHEDEVAVVIDDTLRDRFGKSIEASAKHWDHCRKKSVRSHQVVAAGLSFTSGYIPLFCQIVTGNKKRFERTSKWLDARCEAAKAYDRSLNESKNDFFKRVVKNSAKRFKSKGLKWVIADAWFGNRANLKAIIESGLHGILLVKRDRTKYRYQDRLWTIKELHKALRQKMQKVNGDRFRGVAIEVETNLGSKKDPDWQPVQLILSRPVKNRNTGGWIACICTDLEADMEKVLKVYSLRWSIEVYFKECKQNLGWLNNQSGDYVTSYASMHLSSIRFILLQHAALTEDCGLCDLRNRTQDRMTELSYLGKIWPILMALVFGLLDGLKSKYGSLIEQIARDLRCQLDKFIEQAFRIEENLPDAFPPEEMELQAG